jgi:uncharacterized protein YegJ (DUF2314 family)
MGPRGFDNSLPRGLRSVTCVLAGALLLAGCPDKSGPALEPVTLDDPRPEVARIAVDDPLTARAIGQARKTAGQLLQAFHTRGAAQRDFRFKILVAERGLVEQYWVTLESADEHGFTGIIANHPGDITSVKFGQQVTVPAQEISDWMYVDQGVLKGGYSVRLMRDRLQPEERSEFERQMGFRIE